MSFWLQELGNFLGSVHEGAVSVRHLLNFPFRVGVEKGGRPPCFG